jgi:hypothetical protein
MSSLPPHPDPSEDPSVPHLTGHPTRIGFLRLLLGERLSLTPAEAMEELPEESRAKSLGGANYHLWVLADYGLVEPTGDVTDRGLPYRLTNRGRLVLNALQCEGGSA